MNVADVVDQHKQDRGAVCGALWEALCGVLYVGRYVGRRGLVDSILAFGSIGHGFAYEHRIFSHHSESLYSSAS